MRQLTGSLQWRLSAGLAVAVFVVAALASTVVFDAAFRDANELQDDLLREVAALVDTQVLRLGAGDADLLKHEIDPESRVVVQPLGSSAGIDGALALPADLPAGFQSVQLGHRGWRVLVRVLRDGRRIAVSQQEAVRDEIAWAAGKRTIMPLAALIPLLIGLSIVLVRASLKPVTRLTEELDSRSELDLAPLDGRHVPSEVSPFVGSINHLLARTAQAVEQQRRFVADAAHELRTPLTALTLQTEILAASSLPEQAMPPLRALHMGLGRARKLIEQLLSLARSQSNAQPARTPVSTAKVLRQVVEDLLPWAESLHVDLGVEKLEDAQVALSELDLFVLMRNLVDNAIRYGGAHRRVDIRLLALPGRAVFEVQDEGPGIPIEEQSRIFDPFYRVLGSGETGSGLGLAIVRSVSERLGGEVVLVSPSATGAGTLVRVALPAISSITSFGAA